MSNYIVKPSSNRSRPDSQMAHAHTDMSAHDASRVPQGECPLCYTENPYSISVCTECSLPLPWAHAPLAEREPCGKCIKCDADNPYSTLNCGVCGGRLPWANAVSPTADHVAQLLANSASSLLSLPANTPIAIHPSRTSNPTPVRATSRQPGSHAMQVYSDEPSAALDAVSFLSPPVGLAAYMALAGKSPNRALSARQKSLYGMFMWVPILIVWFAISRGGGVFKGRRDYRSKGTTIAANISVQDQSATGSSQHGAAASD